MKRKNPQKPGTVTVAGHVVPKYCECGGLMQYDYDFGRIWSSCTKCTPVTKITIRRGRVVPQHGMTQIR